MGCFPTLGILSTKVKCRQHTGAPSLLGISWSRGFRHSFVAPEEVKITVPQMGDSVSEGSVASIEHKPGLEISCQLTPPAHAVLCSMEVAGLGCAHAEAFSGFAGDVVKEDDVLLQIETDKVTIDVRYTEAQSGTIKEYLVKEDDTVTPGQEICVVDKGVTDGAESGGAVDSVFLKVPVHSDLHGS